MKVPNENQTPLLEDASYGFEVIAAYDKDKDGEPLRTKAGNDKINLLVQLDLGGGATVRMYDTITTAFPKKFVHFARCGGWEEGDEITAQECVGVKGVAEVEKQEYNGVVRSRIEDYHEHEKGNADLVGGESSDEDDGDGIPF